LAQAILGLTLGLAIASLLHPACSGGISMARSLVQVAGRAVMLFGVAAMFWQQQACARRSSAFTAWGPALIARRRGACCQGQLVTPLEDQSTMARAAGSRGTATAVTALAAGLALALCSTLRASSPPRGAAGRRLVRTRPAVQRAAALSVSLPEGAAECDGEGVECRIHAFDGKVYSLRQLRIWCRGRQLTEEEVLDHWEKYCVPIKAQAEAAVAESAQHPQVEAWRRMWAVDDWQRLWTSKDAGHVHAISGACFALLGAMYLLDVMAHDIALASGFHWPRFMSTEAACAVLALGALNAGSGLQPALLSQPKDLMRTLGLGPKGNPRTGGFINASLFYFFFLYQGLRALPSFPAALTLLDPVVGLMTLISVVHTGVILNAWVGKGSIHRVDALLVPSMLNLPVSLHLLFQGSAWVEQLSDAYPGWPEAFFTANFALAWAASMVTFILSMYERRVISLELRGMFMLAFPVLVFAVIPLHTAQLIPEWFQSAWPTMLTLSPPSA